MHPDIGASLNAMTFVMRDQGRLEEAYEVLLEVLAIARTRFGEEHYAVASTMHNLGILALEMGRPDEAEQRLDAAYAMRRSLLGDVHSEVANSQEGMARLARARGDVDSAREWARRALATYAEVHDREDHPEAERTRALLADLAEDASGD